MDAVISQSKKFARYEIIRKLGRSMTDVYLAFDPKLNRRVILKLIEESNDEYTKLVIEAESRGALIQTELHRNDRRILEVYESGNTEGSFFVSMEYFEGKNIAEMLQIERRFAPRRAALYAAEVCSQLSRLHSFVSDVDGKKRAVVHGDIKPSNIQINRNDELRLLDFGIAKVITYTRNLTQHSLGSPTYCSPERLAKGQVDPHSDLWALGVSLYEMVAGSPPYQAQDTRKLEILIESRRPPRALPEDCPPALAAIITKALAGDIDRRYATAEEFEKDLRAFLNNQPTTAVGAKKPAWSSNPTIQKPRPTVVTARPKKWNPGRAVIGAMGSAIAGTFAWVWRRLPQRQGPRRLRGFEWLRWGFIACAIAAVFFCAYLVGRLRDEVWSHRLDYTHASLEEINSDWAQYLKMRQRDSFLGSFSPAYWRGRQIKANLISAADDVIETWHNSSDPHLENCDWTKAQVCLRRALDFDRTDRTIAGKLALVDGYANLVRNPKLPGAARSENSFRRAAGQIPRSPEPHLGLARLYVYAMQNVGRAMGELRQAERLGFKLGPRENEEEGDGYLLRAESELGRAQKAVARSHGDEDKFLRLAHDDLQRARDLYEPISGFSNVSVSLNHLDDDQSRYDKMMADRAEQPVVNATRPKTDKSKVNHRQIRSLYDLRNLLKFN